MAIVLARNTVQVTIFGTAAGRPWASVWAVQDADGTGFDSAQAFSVARQVMNAWQDHMMPIMSDQVQVQGARFIDLTGVSSPTGQLTPDSGRRTVGAQAGAMAPPNVSLLIRKIGTGGRNARSGRCYLPGVLENNVNPDGSMIPAYLDSITGNLNGFYDGLTGPDQPEPRSLVIIHRPKAAREKGTMVVEASTSRIAQLAIDSRVATQRRRLR